LFLHDVAARRSAPAPGIDQPIRFPLLTPREVVAASSFCADTGAGAGAASNFRAAAAARAFLSAASFGSAAHFPRRICPGRLSSSADTE
jgi:hypothetical protein